MICASVYLLVFIRNLLVHLAEKILLLQPLTFGGDYPVTITTGFMLSRIPDIKDSDGSYEVELRSADIDVRPILNEPEGLLCGNKVFWGFRGAPSSHNWISGIARWKGLSRSSAVILEKRFKDAVCTVCCWSGLIGRAHGTAPDLERRFDRPRRNASDEFGAGSGAWHGSRPAARQAQEDRAIDRVCLRAGGQRQRRTCHSQSDCDRGEELLE